jgi:FixJ family two-component response regulator
MPGLDGQAAAAEINRGRRVPVVLITGRHDVRPAEGDGGYLVTCLLKPVKSDGLRAAVEAAVRVLEPP